MSALEELASYEGGSLFSTSARDQRALENGVMIDGSVSRSPFDRIDGHARIRHRLGIPIPNVALAYE